MLLPRNTYGLGILQILVLVATGKRSFPSFDLVRLHLNRKVVSSFQTGQPDHARSAWRIPERAIPAALYPDWAVSAIVTHVGVF